MNRLHVKISTNGIVEQIRTTFFRGPAKRMTKNTRGNWKRRDEKRGEKSYLGTKRKK